MQPRRCGDRLGLYVNFYIANGHRDALLDSKRIGGEDDHCEALRDTRIIGRGHREILLGGATFMHTQQQPQENEAGTVASIWAQRNIRDDEQGRRNAPGSSGAGETEQPIVVEGECRDHLAATIRAMNVAPPSVDPEPRGAVM
jgi:hypothetical protein